MPQSYIITTSTVEEVVFLFMKVEFASNTTKEEKRQILKYYRKSTNKPKKKKKRKKKPPVNYRKGLTYEQFLQSSYWGKIRFKAMKRDNFKCTVCGSKDDLQVHHTTYKHCGLEYKHMNDLLTLCGKCHYMAHETMEIN